MFTPEPNEPDVAEVRGRPNAPCPSCPSPLTIRGNAAICVNNHRWIRDDERPDWRVADWDDEAGGWR